MPIAEWSPAKSFSQNYKRMMVSPFTFYRGAAAIMAYDLSYTPCTGLTLVADGDCHLLNFGGFATASGS